MKGNKKPYFIRITIASLFFLLSCIAFIPECKVVSYIYTLQFAPAVCKLITAFSFTALLVIFANIFAAWFFGRFYCSTICPFGILQDIIGALLRRKSGQAKNLYILRYIIFVVTAGFIFAGTSVVLRFLDPYSTFGGIVSSFVSFKTVSLVAFIPLIIIIALVAWKNRIFCTSICPVGTVLGLCSKIGYKKLFINSEKCKKCGICAKNCPTGAINPQEQTIDNERCIRCMRCIGYCSFSGIEYGKEKFSLDFSRRTFISTGVLLAVAAGVFSKGKDITTAIVDKFKKRPICPPGAVSPEIFASKCTSCGLCVTQCKGKVIQKPNSEFQTIHLDYEKGKCEFDCKNCSDICPTGALKSLSLKEKQNCRIAMATFSLEECIKCGLCQNACPKGAISQNQGELPSFDASKCIGCGACQVACPMHCINVVAVKKQSNIA